jgi:hypothetical protein
MRLARRAIAEKLVRAHCHNSQRNARTVAGFSSAGFRPPDKRIRRATDEGCRQLIFIARNVPGVSMHSSVRPVLLHGSI